MSQNKPITFRDSDDRGQEVFDSILEDRPPEALTEPVQWLVQRMKMTEAQAKKMLGA